MRSSGRLHRSLKYRTDSFPCITVSSLKPHHFKRVYAWLERSTLKGSAATATKHRGWFVGEMEGRQDKVWFRCTRCHHTSLMELTVSTVMVDGKIDANTATPYDPLSSFKMAKAIFHTEGTTLDGVSKMRPRTAASRSCTFEKTAKKAD